MRLRSRPAGSLRQRNEDLRNTLQHVRAQRDHLLQERNELGRRLAELEDTLAMRGARRLWRLLDRLLPPRSRRRAVYRLLRAGLGRLAGPLTLRTPSPPPATAHDPRADLLAFDERLAARGDRQVVAILSATQLIESEGQRPTQVALELARRGVPVVFVYWRWWTHEWCPQDRLGEGIVQVPIDVVLERPEVLAEAFAGLRRSALFAFPHPGFFDLLAALQAEGWLTAYDVLDDWQEFHRVGQAIWYQPCFERHLLGACDAVLAVNEALAERIRHLGREELRVIGNGLRPDVATVRNPRRLPRGEVTVGYFGHLSAAWFDWGLVAAAAARRPRWRFYLIGYGGPERLDLPVNVELLGKQPQAELAGFAAAWDVAIVPFKPERLASGADPIKIYEYLAMGLPVVVTGVAAPEGGAPFVRTSEGVDAFLVAVEQAVAEPPERVAERRAFAARCTWQRRVDDMLAVLDQGEQRVAEKRALFGGAA